MGVDVSQAYGTIGEAVEMMRSRTLLSYGLISADQVKLINGLKNMGDEAEAYNLVMANVALQEAKLHGLQETSSERWQQAKKEITEATDALKGWLATMIDSVYQAAKHNQGGCAADVQAREIMNAFGNYSAVAGQSVDQAQSALDAELDKIKKKIAAATAKEGKDQTDQIVKALGDWKNRVDLLNPALDEQAKKTDTLAHAAADLEAQITKQGGTQAQVDQVKQQLAMGEQYIAQTEARKAATKALQDVEKQYDAEQKQDY